jgi:hypothetical protein
MMGSQMSAQERLFYSFNLEDHIPPNHLLRGVDRFLDLDSLREHLAPFYSHTGRPSMSSWLEDTGVRKNHKSRTATFSGSRDPASSPRSSAAFVFESR